MMYYATIDNKIGSASVIPDGAVEITEQRYRELIGAKASRQLVTVDGGEVVTYSRPVYSIEGEELKERPVDGPLITEVPPESLHLPKWEVGEWIESETDEQREIREKQELEQEADEVRTQRDALLVESDWAVLPDTPVADEQAWKDYRQALRDVPQQNGFPTDINWPTKPE